MAQNYVLLNRIELNANTASVTFSNIPQTGYTDLKIVVSGRSTYTLGYDQVWLSLNGTANTLTNKRLQGTGSSAASYSSSSSSELFIIDDSNNTANTFGNAELYIPNYSVSGVAKSMSTDVVNENNATTAYSQLNAHLSSITAAITTLTFSLQNGSFVSGSTFSLYGIANASTTPAVGTKATGGNIIATDGSYWYHAFLTNGTFTPTTGINADIMVVAGGGGAGINSGGGAGGLQAFTSQALASGTSYTCTIGSGGVGASGNPVVGATSGANSQFGALTAAVGGGYGGVESGTRAGGAGGSGGGEGAAGSGGGGAGTSGQGNNGGTSGGYAGNYPGGGGGGAGAVGGTATSGTVAGNGGAGSSAYSAWGLATTTGQNVSGTVYFAGGGAGSLFSGGTSGTGGNGGGGAGGTNGTAGTINTGGGGGGSISRNSGAAGGSGIIIIRYAV